MTVQAGQTFRVTLDLTPDQLENFEWAMTRHPANFGKVVGDFIRAAVNSDKPTAEGDLNTISLGNGTGVPPLRIRCETLEANR